MERHRFSLLMVGVLVAITLLTSSFVPVQAWSGGGGMGGGWSGGGWHGGGWHGGGWHGGWRGCCFGPRVFFGVGPLFYPYAYPVYVPPPGVESAPPVYVQQQSQAPDQRQYWYYCPSSQTYYPYVKECAIGWLQVVPQTSPPPPAGAH